LTLKRRTNMAKLPFVVKPRRKPIIELIGTEESGQFEIERRGYLTSGEKSFVQQIQQTESGASEIISLSRKVARKLNLGIEDAYQEVIGIMQNASSVNAEIADQIEEQFGEEITAVVRNLTLGQIREDLVMAACLLRYRIDDNFEINEISKIHPDIISGLAQLYREEEARSLAAFKEESESEEAEAEGSVEEAEKKPKTRASRSRSITGD